MPTLLFTSLVGMALGGWGAGVLYDWFGYYAPAFALGVAANTLHFVVIGGLLLAERERPAAFAR